jgi:YHS domain-containing protein
LTVPRSSRAGGAFKSRDAAGGAGVKLGLFAKKATDPVCGMKVDPQSAKWKFDHEGTAYYFCGSGCMQRFQENPAKFLASGPTGM